MADPPYPRRPIGALRGNLAPFGYRNFRLFWIGFSASHAGRWIELTGAIWLVYELTSSPVMLGLLGIARAGPALALSPIAGVIADRLDQRRLLITTQAMGLLVSSGLGLVVLSGGIEPWHVYGGVALQATITAFDVSVRQALFPRLVPRDKLPEAVTLAITAGRSAKLIGPAAGGVAIAAWGEAAPFLVNAATFLALMGALAAMRGVVPRAVVPGSTFRRELAEGLRHLTRAPVLSGILKLEVVFGLLQVNPVIITIIGREVLSVGPAGLGGLLSAPALGSIAGISAMLVLRQPSRQGRSVVVSTFTYALALVTLAGSQTYGPIFALLVGIGVVDAVLTVTRHSVMQLAAPSHMRGRIMANMGMVTRGTSPLAETQSGVMAGAVGPPLALVGAAAALAVAAVAIGRSHPALWTYRREAAVSSPLDTDWRVGDDS